MITLNVFVRVKPQHREELLQIGRALFDELAKQLSFIDACLNTAMDQPDLIVVYERWNETKESFVQNILPKPFTNLISIYSNESALAARLTGWRNVVRGVPQVTWDTCRNTQFNFMTPPSSPPDNFGDIAFTPSVKAVQERLGSRHGYGRFMGLNHRTRFGPEEQAFIEQRDTFYVATVGENGWPYVQHRGGPAGFLRVLDEQTLGFADFRGNRQYVTTGNVSATHHACLFLMDYPNQTRLKIWAEAETSEDAGLIARLVVPDYPAVVERAFLFRVLAFDWNCEQHIIRRFTPDEYIAEFGCERFNE